MSSALAVSDATFQEEVLNSSTPVLVDFWATWCNPCQQMSPIVDAVAQELEGKVKVVKLDIDKNPLSPSKYSISSIPTFLLFANGEIVMNVVGGLPKAQLLKKIEAALA